MQFTDQLNRKIQLKAPPKRIISLVPSQTELLIDLGLEAQLVGITKFCVHPTRIRKEKSIVGGTKSIKEEKIKALQPDIILCNKEENTKEMVEQLTQIAPVHVSDITTIEDSLRLIASYGKLFSVEEKAMALVNEIKLEWHNFQEFIQKKPFKKVAYVIWRNPWMVAGGKTFINALLHLNKLENVYKTIPRYPEIEIDKLRDVDYILLSSEPFPFNEQHKEELSNYIASEKIQFIDGEFFSWYGSRLRKAFPYFKKWRQVLED